MNEWSYTSTPPMFLHGADRGNLNILQIQKTQQALSAELRHKTTGW